MTSRFIEEYKNHDYSLLKSYDIPHSTFMTQQRCERIIKELLEYIDKEENNSNGDLNKIIRKIELYSLPDDIHILNYLRIELLKEIKIHDNDNKKFLYTTMSSILLTNIIYVCLNEIKKLNDSLEAKKPSVS